MLINNEFVDCGKLNGYVRFRVRVGGKGSKRDRIPNSPPNHRVCFGKRGEKQHIKIWSSTVQMATQVPHPRGLGLALGLES